MEVAVRSANPFQTATGCDHHLARRETMKLLGSM